MHHNLNKDFDYAKYFVFISACRLPLTRGNTTDNDPQWVPVTDLYVEYNVQKPDSSNLLTIKCLLFSLF
jgi:hypothetical protein